MDFPILNPIRIRSVSSSETRMDMRTQRVKYTRGNTPINVYPDYLLGSQIQVQSINNNFNISYARIYSDENIIKGNLNVIDITPTGWSGGKVLRFETILTQEGYYYLEIRDSASNLFRSDVFKVKDNFMKDLVWLRYLDARNEFGLFYSTPNNPVWTPQAYFTGNIRFSSPESERIVSKSEYGNETLLRSTPQRVRVLQLADIHDSYIDVVDTMLSCAEFYVDNDMYIAKEPEVEPTEFNDVVDITYKLILQENDYLLKY